MSATAPQGERACPVCGGRGPRSCGCGLGIPIYGTGKANTEPGTHPFQGKPKSVGGQITEGELRGAMEAHLAECGVRPEPPTPDAIPPEAIDEAAKASWNFMLNPEDTQWEDAHPNWQADERHLVKDILEAAAPAIRAQDQARIQELERQRSAALAAVLIERERMIERVTAKRRDEEIVYTPFLQGHDQGITDAIRAIRSAADDE